MNLFKQARPKKAQRIYRVENLNPEKEISMSYKVSEDQKKHVVCLFLPHKTVKNTFFSQNTAFEQMRKYRSLYKAMEEGQ